MTYYMGIAGLLLTLFGVFLLMLTGNIFHAVMLGIMAIILAVVLDEMDK